MPVGGEYTKKPMGILTFRGDAFRQNAAQGTVTDPQLLEIAWRTEAGSSRGASQTYYGISWTGQPAIVKWSKEVREKSNLYEAKIEKSGLKEVIIAGMDGVIYFLDLADGNLTRNSIKLGYPMKGSPSVHPSGYPFMTVGQFARKMKVKTGKIGLRQYNLYSGKELSLIDGLDGKLHRAFNDIGSFETSALIDRTSDTLITAGTNGLLYLVTLGSDFDYEAGIYKQSESNVVLKSKAKGEKKDSQTAVESSLAMYDRYVFYADMGGVLRCVDTNTLQTVWAVNTGDAVMAAVALDLTESRELNLYTANMYANRKKGKGEIQIRRYDALSGKEAWCTDIGVVKGKKEKADVGAKASPVIGEEKLKDLVFFTVTGLSEEGCDQLGVPGESKSALIALDKDTGKVQWAMGMESRTVSSPVAVYDKNGDGWIIQCAQDGNIYMVEGLSGAKTASLKLEAEVIASPAVYNNIMVIGTTGKGTSFIYGIEIRTLASAEDGEPEAVEAEPEEATKEMQEEPEGEAEPEEEAGAEEPAEDA
jgi:outer membrane protein assembly factor BamB